MTTYSTPASQHQEGQQDHDAQRTLHAVIEVTRDTVYLLCGCTAPRHYRDTGRDRLTRNQGKGITCKDCITLVELERTLNSECAAPTVLEPHTTHGC